MGTFSRRFPMASENHMQNPFPQFPGGFPGTFFAENFGSYPSQATHMNPKPCFTTVPIPSVAPTNGPMNYKGKTKPAKGKDNCFSPKDTTHFKMSRPKQTKKRASTTKKTKGPVELGRNVERKNPDLVYDESNVDFSRVPPPFCSCTGVARACYKWGSGSWQSSCCNTTMSQYPLPKSPSKPGARINGRKMSSGAYRKLLCRFAAEGRDLSQPVDLKNHWAKLGTNKFVTIK